MLVSAQANFTNPTNYSATVPFVDLLVLYNDTVVAHLTAHNISVGPGNNSYVPVDFFWCPLDEAGADGVEAGRALLSSYVSGQVLLGMKMVNYADGFFHSGLNTTITIKSYRNTIPSLPNLGEALSVLNITVPIPRISIPGSPGSDDDDNKPHFIQDATVHAPSTHTMSLSREEKLATNTYLLINIVLSLVLHGRIHPFLTSNGEQCSNHLNRRNGFL